MQNLIDQYDRISYHEIASMLLLRVSTRKPKVVIPNRSYLYNTFALIA